MSTKVDLNLGVKAELSSGLGDKKANLEGEQNAFQRVLDAAVSTRAAKNRNQEGKQSPESVDSNHSPTLPVKETIQKSLESRRTIITTESDTSPEELETFAAKQGLSSVNLSDLLNQESVVSQHVAQSFNSNEQTGSKRNQVADNSADKTAVKISKSFQSEELNKPQNSRYSMNSSEIDLLKNVAWQKSFGGEAGSDSKIPQVPLMNEKSKQGLRTNAIQNLKNSSTDSSESMMASQIVGKMTKIGNSNINKSTGASSNQIKIKDLLIKSVELKKESAFYKMGDAALKLPSISLAKEFSNSLEIKNQSNLIVDQLKVTQAQISDNKTTLSNSNQYSLAQEIGQPSVNELKEKSDEQLNNLSRFNKLQTISAKFADSLASRLTSQINQGAWRVEMEIHPKSLGKVSIQMEMVNGNLEAQFFTNQSLTRDLILESMPRLREMLENNGTNHAEVSVELKNDGNNDKKFAPVERIESEAKEEEFVETASQDSPGEQKGDLGRYDFLV